MIIFHNSEKIGNDGREKWISNPDPSLAVATVITKSVDHNAWIGYLGMYLLDVITYP